MIPPSNGRMENRIEAELQKRILVLDGAMGTAIQQKPLTADDFGGEDLDGCNEYLVITRPKVIQEIHEAHLEAGCDIIETNTFGGTPLVLDEFLTGERTLRSDVIDRLAGALGYELNRVQ